MWEAYASTAVRGARLGRSARADVVVVGAGISGALIAQSLAEAGLRPLILDRRRSAVLGSTAASTALLQYELDTPLLRLSSAIGTARASRVWLASREAVNELRSRTRRLGINAHLQTRSSLYLAGDQLGPRGLRLEAKRRDRIGLSSEFLDRKALRRHFGLNRPAALLSHNNAQANPVQLAAGYLRDAVRRGARLHVPHEVLDLQRRGRDTTLLTDSGIEITARHVVLCTGYELAKIVPAMGSRVVSTWAMATAPQPAALWPQQALIWEASAPYLYARCTSDGRVICGGEDEELSDPQPRNALMERKTKRLQAKLSRLFPGLDPRARSRWTGSFGASVNGMPSIGEIPGWPRCYAVMGYGGNGITFSMLAANLITAAILRRSSPDARLFSFE